MVKVHRLTFRNLMPVGETHPTVLLNDALLLVVSQLAFECYSHKYLQPSVVRLHPIINGLTMAVNHWSR